MSGVKEATAEYVFIDANLGRRSFFTESIILSLWAASAAISDEFCWPGFFLLSNPLKTQPANLGEPFWLIRELFWAEVLLIPCSQSSLNFGKVSPMSPMQ